MKRNNWRIGVHEKIFFSHMILVGVATMLTVIAIIGSGIVVRDYSLVVADYDPASLSAETLYSEFEGKHKALHQHLAGNTSGYDTMKNFSADFNTTLNGLEDSAENEQVITLLEDISTLISEIDNLIFNPADGIIVLHGQASGNLSACRMMVSIFEENVNLLQTQKTLTGAENESLLSANLHFQQAATSLERYNPRVHMMGMGTDNPKNVIPPLIRLVHEDVIGIVGSNDDINTTLENLTLQVEQFNETAFDHFANFDGWMMKMGTGVHPREATLEVKINELITITQELAEEAITNARSARNTFVTSMLVILALTLVGGIYYARRLSRSIVDRDLLVSLANAANGVSKGNFNIKINIPTRDDEVKTLAQAFERMLTSLRIVADMQPDINDEEAAAFEEELKALEKE